MTAMTLSGWTLAEWQQRIAATDATLKSQGVAVPTRIAIVAHGKPAPKVAAPAPPLNAPAPAEDPALMTTEKLWERCYAIKDSAARTRYFRAHIKPRIHA